MDDTTFSGFGDLLKFLRKRQHLTQKDLAVRLSVHRNTIGSWENGDFLPESKTIVLELAYQLKLDTDDTRRLLEASLTALSPHWHIPYQRNPFFTGREDILHSLHENLTSKQTVVLSQSYALSGLGGVGKTQTAIEYSYRYANEYAAVFWIRAETMDSIIASMATLATLLNLPEKQEKEQSKMVAAVVRWLNNHGDWLLILDNIEDIAVIKDILPTARRGSILFTTRKQALGLSAQIFSLAPMDMEEGLRFLLRRARYDSLEQLSMLDEKSARAIVEAMDGLPLALDQAGAYIEENQCSLSDYLQLFQNFNLRLLYERESYSDHPLSVTKTFTLAFEQLEKSNPKAAEILTVCAFLAPEAIPETFFLQGAVYLGPTFELLAADPLTFNTAIKALLSYSLLQRNAATHTVIIHRVVQAVLKENLSSEKHYFWIERIVQVLNQIFPENKEMQADYLQKGEQILPHALIGIKFSAQCTEDSISRIKLMKCVAAYFVYRARYMQAEKLLQETLNISNRVLNPNHHLIAEIFYELAVLRKAQGIYIEAVTLLERVNHMGEQILDKNQSFAMMSMHQLATIYREQGEYEKAEIAFLHALNIGEQIMETSNPRIASIIDNLAILYAEQGKYAEAEPLFQKALQNKVSALGSDHLMVTFPLINLAILYAQLGKYKEAEPLFLRALHIREKVLDAEHPELAFPITNLAILYKELGKYEESEPLFLRAIHIREQTLGSNHLQVAFPLNSLADLYLEQGQYDKAAILYRRTLHIREQGLGSDHVQLAFPLYGLAEMYREQREYGEAEPLYRRALLLRENAYGKEHDEVAQALTGLATLLSEQGNYRQAEPLYRRALVMRQRLMGSQHHSVADTLHHFAWFYQLQQQASEACTQYQQALIIRERALGLDHPKTIATRIAYTHLLAEMK